MIRPLISLTFILATIFGYAQKIPLINSGAVIERATQLYDSGSYDKAVEQLLTVSKQDTNYVYMLSELALTYIAQEKYQEAIETCDKALVKPTTFRSHLLRSKAIALDKKGDYKASVEVFTKTIEEFPFDFRTIYNLGITHYNKENYEKAMDCFFRVLEINPYHAGSHFNLSRLSVGMGMKTHAMMAMGIYLAVNNEDNERLVFIDKVVSNQVDDEGSLIFTTPNSCGKLDQIIRAKVAMDKNFKSSVPVDAPVVKQYEMFFEQLGSLPETSDDRFLKFYLPIFKEIKAQNAVVPFMYHILASASNEDVKKWRKKNEKELKRFYDIGNSGISAKRALVTAPAGFKYDGAVQAWYDGNNLESLGKKNAAGKNEGQWYYFNDNYFRIAEGKFNAEGKKIGIWKYYYPTGVLKSIENMDTGEVTVFFESGPKSQHFFLKNDEIDGDVELFFECGGVREKSKYKAGKRHGKGVSYFSSGAKDVEFEYADDKLTGEYLSYFENGVLFSKNTFKEDNIVGRYVEYFANGKIKAEGEYVDGKHTGPWKYYHSNGKLEKEGVFKAGKGDGEWKYYNSIGELTEKRNLAEGRLQGENTMYHDGKVHFIVSYKNDLAVKIQYFDKNGKELFKAENGSGNFNVKSYYAHGQLNGEGAYKKGKMEGAWKFYYPEGSKRSEFSYKDGELDGKAREFFRNGAVQFDMSYKAGQFDGYFIEYFGNGQIKQEGWFQQGERQQQWITYHTNGNKETEYYYLNDNLTGDYADYGATGKIYSASVYKRGKVESLKYFNSKGELITVVTEKGNSKIYENKYKSGKIQATIEIQCGNYVGNLVKRFPDGSLFYSYPLMVGNKHGVYKYYHLSGELALTGMFVNGSEEGNWKWFYENGKLDNTGKYTSGLRDSVWTFYHPNGKISSTQHYRDNKRDGLVRYFGLDGTPVLEKTYESGNLILFRAQNASGKFGEWVSFTGEQAITAYYANGKKAIEETYKSGNLDGIKKIYYPDGSVYSEYLYKAGDYHGAFKEFYANGKVSEKGTFVDDELEGEYITYYEDGTVQRTENYVCGERHGKAVYFKKGVKVKELTFWAGVPE